MTLLTALNDRPRCTIINQENLEECANPKNFQKQEFYDQI